MVGYGEIVPAAPLVASTVPPPNPMRRYLRKVRRVIAGQGFSEVYNYSFVTAEKWQRFGSISRATSKFVTRSRLN